MADTAKMRRDVRAILDRHGFDNKFSIRTVSFSDLARARPQLIIVRKWRPSPKARIIERDILNKYPKVIINFD